MQLHVPTHLSEGARNWLDALREDREFSATEWRLAQLAAEAWDRSQTARRTLSREGLTLNVTKWQGSAEHGKLVEEIRAHPAAAIARDNANLFAKLVTQLGLDRASAPAAGLDGEGQIAGQTNIIDELAARRASSG